MHTTIPTDQMTKAQSRAARVAGDENDSCSAHLSSDRQPPAIANDHRDLFERDVIPHTSYLLGHAQALTKQRQDAEDLVQDTLIKAYTSFKTFRVGSNMKSWLYRILMNTWVDRYRQTQRRPTLQLSGDLADPQLNTHAALIYGATQSAETDALSSVPSRAEDLLSTLPQDLRETVYFADIEGYRNTEIALKLGIPVGTVGSRLHRGRALLRRLLLDECA